MPSFKNSYHIGAVTARCLLFFFGLGNIILVSATSLIKGFFFYLNFYFLFLPFFLFFITGLILVLSVFALPSFLLSSPFLPFFNLEMYNWLLFEY